LGQWKNFDELESTLTVEELLKILDASREREHENRKFLAALKGIDLDKDNKPEDLADFKGVEAYQKGFGIGLGIGHRVEGE